MTELTPLIETYGYPLLIAFGFLEFAGFPIALTPLVVAAGATVAAGLLDPLPVLLAVAVGGMTADAGWFWAARWRGSALVDAACGLSSSPMGCVKGVEHRLTRVGTVYVLVAKFVPGAANLIAPVSGLSPMRPRRFFLLDTISLVVWTAFFMAMGALFDRQVIQAMGWLQAHVGWVIPIAILLVALAGVWRLFKVRLHRSRHRADRRVHESRGRRNPSAPSLIGLGEGSADS